MLGKISTLAQDVAEAIKAAFTIDVEIVDHNLVRIAATGYAHKKVGERMRFGTASREVIIKGQPIIIQSTKHPICKTCPGQGNCNYEGGIVAPVYFDKKVVGTINMVAYNEESMDIIYKSREGIIHFIEKMSVLIESKLKEEDYILKKLAQVEELKVVANLNPNGVLITDEKGLIKYGNNVAYSILSETEESLIGSCLTSLFNDFPLNLLHNHHTVDEGELIIESIRTGKVMLCEYKRIMNHVNVIGMTLSFKHILVDSKSNEQKEKVKMEHIKGKSHIIKELKLNAIKFAKSNSTILITGENGTGKDLLAQAIHQESGRTGKFVAINCSAIPESLIESELFGYEKGAFTGANHIGKIGKFELANKGTIFLDEIGTMPLHLQVKLLRVIQNREIDRIGGKEAIKIDVRIIAATNEDLMDLVKKGRFREDLFYRLHVIPLHLPALRDRKEDIPLLVDGFLEKFKPSFSKSVTKLSNEAYKLLQSYHWPGNIRELENVIEYAFNDVPSCKDVIDICNFPSFLHKADGKSFNISSEQESDEKNLQIDHYEEKMIRRLLNQYGRSTQAKKLIAQKLNISTATLYRKIQKYKINPSHFEKFSQN